MLIPLGFLYGIILEISCVCLNDSLGGLSFVCICMLFPGDFKVFSGGGLLYPIQRLQLVLCVIFSQFLKQTQGLFFSVKSLVSRDVF